MNTEKNSKPKRKNLHFFGKTDIAVLIGVDVPLLNAMLSEELKCKIGWIDKIERGGKRKRWRYPDVLEILKETYPTKSEIELEKICCPRI